MHRADPRLSLVSSRPNAAEGAAFASRTDDELMLLARGGVKDAFGALVRRHQRRVLRLAAHRLGESSLAADVAQGTFLDIYRARDQYQPRGVFVSYLYRVLLNRCSALRRGELSQSASRELWALEVGVTAPDRPEEQVLARERLRQVQRSLGQLSKKQQNAVLLRYAADLSYEEMARTLNEPLGTVKRRLFDALEKLRELTGAP